MPYFRRPKNHDHPFAQISNDMLEDEDLSFKAKGLLSYLLSRSDEWEVYQSQLADLGPDGKTSVRSGLDELMEKGYLVRNTLRHDDGTFKGREYVIYEQGNAPSTPQNPETGKPDFGDPDIEKPHTTNTDEQQHGQHQHERDAPAREGDPLNENEAVTAYHDVMPRRANNVQKDKIATKVDDVDRWRDVIEDWRCADYNASNVKGMLDVYENGWNDYGDNGQSNGELNIPDEPEEDAQRHHDDGWFYDDDGYLRTKTGGYCRNRGYKIHR